MSAEGIPADVADFLRVHIESYEALEVALFLASRPLDTWAPADVGTELRLPSAVAETVLEALTRVGLVSRVGSGGARFRAHEDARPQLDRLQVAYRDHRVELMSLMTANALDRVRTSALRAFANAFLVRNRRDDR